MTEQVEELVTYSIRMCGPEEFERLAKLALSELLVSAARSIEDFDGFPLTEIDEMSLELVSKRWDRTFVLKLKRKADGKSSNSTDAD